MSIFGVWLGPNEPPELERRCIATWQGGGLYTDEELIRLGVVDDQFYYHDALAAKHWAGASDVARLTLLHRVGGIYLDTDVEVVRPPALHQMYQLALQTNTLFIGTETEGGDVCGAVIVSPPRHAFLTEMLELYKRTRFADTFQGTVNGTTLLTGMSHAFGGAKNHAVTCLPPSVFYPWHWRERDISDEEKARRKAPPQVLTAHHWSGSWVK